jgi:cytochrome P450
MEPLDIMGALLTSEGRDNPYPLYDEAHRLGAVLDAGEGFVMVPSYDECNQVLRNTSFGVWDVDLRGEIWDDEQQRRPSLRSMERSVIYSNAPDHGRMRSLISSVFTPRRVAALEPAISAIVDALLDQIAEAGAGGTTVDLMDGFAYQLPVSVICDLMGIPPADRETFRQLATRLAAVLDYVEDLSRLDGADAAWLELELYFGGLLAERRTRPQDDLVSALIAVCDAGDARLSAAELLCNLALLLVAGFETTANLFGNGVRLLFEHPEVGAGLRNGRLRYAGFAEEVLRYDSPVQMTTRIALTDGLSIGEVAAPPGTEVAVMIGAANRDARRYQDPERFDPTRTEIGPLSFGAGPHFCVGSVLARTEAAIGFPRLLDRFPALAPAGEPTRNQRFILRGYEHLPVTVT